MHIRLIKQNTIEYDVLNFIGPVDITNKNDNKHSIPVLYACTNKKFYPFRYLKRPLFYEHNALPALKPRMLKKKITIQAKLVLNLSTEGMEG